MRRHADTHQLIRRMRGPSTACLALPLIMSLSCSRPPGSVHTVRFFVTLDSAAIGQRVYLTGSSPALGSWNPAAVPLSPLADSLWSTSLTLKDREEIEYNVTAGSWWTQGLDRNEGRYENFRLRADRDTVVRIRVRDWLNRMANGRPVLSPARFRPGRPALTLDGLWRYHEGDTLLWAGRDCVDSSWVITDPSLQWTEPSDPKWSGVGWFRFHMYVDSSLWNRTLAIRMFQLGASEVYYNGRLLYTFGRVGSADAPYRPNAMTWWQEFRVDPGYDQLIAVRYANWDWKNLQGMGYDPGFLITLHDLNVAFRSAADVRENAERQTALTVIPLVLALVHLSLYGFLRSQRQNLYYAVCMLGYAGLTYFGYERALVVDVSRILLFTKLDQISVSVAILFGVMTVLELNYRRLPKRVWAYVGVFLCLSVLVLAGSPLGLNMTLYYLFFGLTTLETIAAIVRRKPKRMYGGWILVAGFTVTAGFGVIQLLVDYGIVPGTPATVQSYAYGMLSLAVAMSLFLSYNFAHVNRDLARQVNTVSRLSDEALQQEKLASKLALERKTIEVEHERQAKELESARELQLSLLPKEVPRIDGLDIAAFMKTATEVGGDYYDFFSPREGALMVAIGDATGHGLRAGNMVTATKGLLHALAGMERLEDILGAANQAIKQMRLHMLTMCLALARIEGQRVSFSSAGMPPLLVWRAAAGRCERHVLKAMPLGAVEHFPFAGMELTCARGDAIVLVSDGLFEVFDANGEIYGMENVMKSVERHAGKPAEDVAAGLVRDVTAWGKNSPLNDDLTIVVVKFGPHGARP